MPPGGPGGHGGPMSRGFMTEEEKANAPKVTKELLKRIFSYLTPHWKMLTVVFLCVVLSSIFTLLPSILTGKIIDEGLIGQNMGAPRENRRQIIQRLIFVRGDIRDNFFIVETAAADQNRLVD